MRLLLAAALLLTFTSCTKTDAVAVDMPASENIPVDAVSQLQVYSGPNPVAGKWLFGKFARWCGTDSTVYENNNGNYIDFRDNDTAYSTYVTDGSSGYGSYAVINANTVSIYGEVYKIISSDEQHFTLYYEQQDGWIRQWWTFLKFPEQMD